MEDMLEGLDLSGYDLDWTKNIKPRNKTEGQAMAKLRRQHCDCLPYDPRLVSQLLLCQFEFLSPRANRLPKTGHFTLLNCNTH